MEQELRFGLNLGQMADFPKLQNLLTYEIIIYLKNGSIICGTFWCIKYIWNLKKKYLKFFIGLETFSIVFRPTRDTSPGDFSICNDFGFNWKERHLKMIVISKNNAFFCILLTYFSSVTESRTHGTILNPQGITPKITGIERNCSLSLYLKFGMEMRSFLIQVLVHLWHIL